MTARQRYANSITACVLVGAIAGVATSFLLPRTYISAATLFIEPKRGSASDWINEALQYVLGRISLRGIVESEGLYKRELERLPMEDIIENMRRDIQIEKIGQVGTVRAIRVSFRHQDGVTAEVTTRVLMDRIISPGTTAEVLAAEPSWQPLSLEMAQAPRRVQTAPTRIGRIGSALRRVAFAGNHGPITYAGVLRVRGAKSPSVGAPDASELRNLVLDALKQKALLEPEAGSVDATMARMRRRLRLETGRLGDELNIFYSDASPAKAQSSLQDLLARVLEADSHGSIIEQLGPPSLPESYEELTPRTMTLAGAGIGLLLGLAVLQFFSKRDRPT